MLDEVCVAMLAIMAPGPARPRRSCHPRRVRAMRPVVLLVGLLAAVSACEMGPSVPSPAVAGPWTTVAAAPAGLTEVAVAAHDGKIWVAGGLHADGTVSDAVFVFDPMAGTWSTGPTLP